MLGEKENIKDCLDKDKVSIKLSEIMFEDDEFINLDKLLELSSEDNSLIINYN